MAATTDDGPEGLLLVDKSSGPTSHDVVGRARAVLRTRRVGHAGTLDPMATGLLILGVGRATKLLGHLALTAKSYLATVRLGVRTATDDADGEVTARADASGLGEPAIAAAMAALTGPLMQVPSSVSAIKVDGRRAYARVRAGEDVTLPARPVTVTRFSATSGLRPCGAAVDVDVVVDCSTGTYVRALARDLGEALGVGAHLTALRRTSVGPFRVAGAADLFPDGVTPRGAPRPEIPESLRRSVTAAILPVSTAAGLAFPVRGLTAGECIDLGHGRAIAPGNIPGVYAGLAPAGDLVALLSDRDGAARPVLVWRPAG